MSYHGIRIKKWEDEISIIRWSKDDGLFDKKDKFSFNKNEWEIVKEKIDEMFKTEINNLTINLNL